MGKQTRSIGRDRRFAFKDTLFLQELQRELQKEMEQDCAAAAHHQQAASLGKACLLACRSREASSSREGQRARMGIPLEGLTSRILQFNGAPLCTSMTTWHGIARGSCDGWEQRACVRCRV
eukprot:1158451-Pelagomonas_calceolata.AAC.2